MNELTGRNYFLYFLLAVNIILALIIFYGQEKLVQSPPSVTPKVQNLAIQSIKLPMILTNILPTKNLKRYLRVKPVLILEKEQVLEEFKAKETLIKDQIISYINKQSETLVLSENGLNTVRENIKKIINKILTKNQVSMVYFAEFRVN